MNGNYIPVIAIDGPSASGKGTVAQRVAAKLGFHYLDSGALYRLVALVAMRSGGDLGGDEKRLSEVARELDVVFKGTEIRLGNEDVADAIRSEACGNAASKIAAYPAVRAALLARQRAFRQLPGLVTDGRDMGSVVFPEAALKIFLTATAEARAERRYKQLMAKGIDANIATLLQDIQERDARDSNRSVAPLQLGADTNLLDTTSLNIAQAVDSVLQQYAETRAKARA
ncbi:(d)CMP kinase [Nitrosospira briensis]|uniref:Cytidylate kinase n=1 Tax=Nitrosospira briensis TaxID=35799 RepID=A0A1I5D459_9PROT|nr:(d)CMP kinase [Nitrosospira briensis]SFN94000.1 3-phosphoshikimate 1-carboxyvinyltransferase/cytidylate kinase [Nitrosospira briensis]SFO18466.1 cytidylate kinase [Nitrosospira briensis]